jgi:O-antigen ligase
MPKEYGGHALPFWGLLAFAVWSPVSIAGANIAWVATLLLWGLQAFRDRKNGIPVLRRTALDPAFALFLFASLLSLCVSLDPMESLREFRSLGLIAVYYLFAWNVKSRGEARILLGVWFAVSALAAAYGAVEYFSGWDFLGHYDPRTNKIGGFFSMHLTFSEYLLLALCLCAGVLFWDQPVEGKKRIALRAAFVILLTGFLLARAKGAWLGLLAGMSLICALKGRRALGMMWFLVLLPLLLFAAWNAQYLYTHLLSQFVIDADRAAGYAHSNTQRLFMWWAGFRISMGHFLNGVGLHAVEAVYPEFRHALARDPNQWHLHSNFVQLGVTRGLFGLCAFLYLFLLAGRTALARFRTSLDPWERALSAGALGAFAGFLVSGLTEYSWGDSEVLMALYMVLGIAVSNPYKRPETEGVVPVAGGASGVRKAGFTVLLALVCLAFLGFPAPQVNTGTCVLEAVLALFMFGSALTRFFLKEVFPEDAGGAAAPGNLSSPLFFRALACAVTYAGYSFTRPFWLAAEQSLGNTEALFALVGILSLCFLMLFGLYVKDRGTGVRWGLFDTAFTGAAVLWAALALGTGVLLEVASGSLDWFAPPVPAVFLLCAFIASLYGAARVLACRGRVPDLLLALLGVCMLVHAMVSG